MRLLKTLPELEPKIRSGELTFTTAARAQGFFKEESKRREVSREEKKATLESLFNQSTRECERRLAAISPVSALPKERERAVTEELTQIQFLADRELLKKLEKLKGLLGHRNFEGSYAVLFNQLADLALKKLAPAEKQTVMGDGAKTSSAQNEAERHNSTTANPLNALQAPPTKPSRFIPAAVRRAVTTRDRGKCTYTDRQTKRRCDSRHALEYDHRMPLSLGGETSADNLRLLCKAHHGLVTKRLATLL